MSDERTLQTCEQLLTLNVGLAHDYAEQLDEAMRLLRAGIEAFHFTREYIGEERLPEIEGWSWYDWCEQARAFLAASGEAK